MKNEYFCLKCSNIFTATGDNKSYCEECGIPEPEKIVETKDVLASLDKIEKLTKQNG